MMRAICVWGIVSALIAFSGFASTGDGGKWACFDEGLANSSYSGGDHTMIQLQGFAYGGSYMVVKNSATTEATGTTVIGTHFCARSCS